MLLNPFLAAASFSGDKWQNLENTGGQMFGWSGKCCGLQLCEEQGGVLAKILQDIRTGGRCSHSGHRWSGGWGQRGGSDGGRVPPGFGVYGSTKRGLDFLTKVYSKLYSSESAAILTHSVRKSTNRQYNSVWRSFCSFLRVVSIFIFPNDFPTYGARKIRLRLLKMTRKKRRESRRKHYQLN